MRHIFLLAACVVSATAHGQSVVMVDNPAATDQTGSSFTLRAFAGNDMVPIMHLDDSPWPNSYRRKGGDNLAIADVRAAISSFEQRWSLSYIYRQDWFLRTNADTVDAYAQGTQGLLDSQARTYDLNYQARGLSADAVRLGYAHAFTLNENSRLSMGAAVSVLRGQSLRIDVTRGLLTTNGNSASLTATRDLFNTEMEAKQAAAADGLSDFTPTNEKSVPYGYGYGLDIGARYTMPNGAYIGVAANDLAARIRWSQVPHLRLTVSDAQVDCVDDSCSASRIGADWTSTYDPVTLELKPRYLIEGSQPLGMVRLRAQVERMDGANFAAVGCDYPLANGWVLALDYDQRFRTFSISARSQNLFVLVGGDKFDVDSARALQVSAGVRLAF